METTDTSMHPKMIQKGMWTSFEYYNMLNYLKHKHENSA